MKYDQKIKDNVLKRFTKDEESVAEIARKTKINRVTITNWIEAASKGKTKKKGTKVKTPKTPVYREEQTTRGHTPVHNTTREDLMRLVVRNHQLSSDTKIGILNTLV